MLGPNDTLGHDLNSAWRGDEFGAALSRDRHTTQKVTQTHDGDKADRMRWLAVLLLPRSFSDEAFEKEEGLDVGAKIGPSCKQ